MRLETARLTLRAMDESDAPQLVEIYKDAILTRFMGAGPSVVAQEVLHIERHREQHYDRKGYGILAFVHRETGELIGRGGFMHIAVDGEELIELTYLLGAEYRKQGFVTEAVQELLRWAREELKLDHVVALIHPDNVDSVRVVERSGFEHVGFSSHPHHEVVVRYDIHLQPD